MLGRLVNVPPFDDRGWSIPAGHFVDKYGPLRENHPPSKDAAEQEVAEFARKFREAWEWKTDPAFDYQQFNRMLEGIFVAGDPVRGDSPVLRANFRTGAWEPTPRNLLEVLAMQLMSDRRMLHRCERPDCRRYFVKSKSRDRYCKFLVKWERVLDRVGTCAEVMRRRGQSLSAEKHREETNKRRRQPAKSRKGRGKK